MYYRWLIDLESTPSWYRPFALRRINDRGIRHITNNRGDKLSPWKIPRLILTSPRSSPVDLSVVFQLPMLSLDIRSDTRQLQCFKYSYIHAIARFVFLRLQFRSTILSMINWSFVPLEPFQHPFCSSGINSSVSRWSYIFSERIPLKIFHNTGRHVMGRKFSTEFPSDRSFTQRIVLPWFIQGGT